LKIVKNRTQGIEKWHKANKAFYLAGGRFVDAVKNKEIVINEEMESKLLEAEKYFENLEKQKAKELNDDRIERIKPYVEDTTGLDFAPMSDEDFDDYLLGKKTRFENEEKEREAEALRIKQNRIDTDRRTSRELILLNIEGVKRNNNMTYTLKCIENEDFSNVIDMSEILDCSDEQFKKYLDEFISTRDENEKFINKQKSENIRLEAELKEKQDAEIKAENARIAKEKAEKLEAEKLAKAPIKKQLSIWVDSFELPECTTYNATSKEIAEKFQAFKKWSINQVNNL
jgi:hypothetical protein